jgi:TonB-dependent receptor
MFVFTNLPNLIKRTRLSLVFIVLLTIINPVKAQSSDNKPNSSININITQSTLQELISALEQQSSYVFFFDKVAAKKIPVTNFRLGNATLSHALKKMRHEFPLDYQILRNEVTIKIESAEQHQRRLKDEQPGKISGKVFDDKGGILPGANIRIPENNISSQSGADGSYQLLLPPGVYSMEVSYISFITKKITEIIVRPGQNTPLDISLQNDSKSLSEVIVTSSYRKASVEGLYARQKNNAAVSDGITADQIGRTPATNTAQVLAKISGLQISNDRNVVIRGLSDRYNNVLLNGAILPSSEPNRRDFAFDMIPSALIDNIVVNKTATPDLTGEFTGGLVQINTKDIPTENFFQLTIGSGYNTRATGKNTLGLDHGKNAWLGFASDIHKKPMDKSFGDYNALITSVDMNALTPEQRKQINSYNAGIPDNWRMKQHTGQPIHNYQAQAGYVLPFKNDTRLGIVGAFTYRNEQRADQKDINNIQLLEYRGTQYKYTTTLGGSLNAGYSFGANKITLQNTYNRKFSDDLWRYDGTDFDNSNNLVSNYNNITVINTLLQSQLEGEHAIGKRGIKIDWNISNAHLDRDQPYSKILSRNRPQGTPDGYYAYSLGADARLREGSLYYSELNEKVNNWGTNIQAPFKFLQQNQLLKLGYQGKYRVSNFDANMYRISSLNPVNYQGQAYYNVYNQANFATNLYLLPLSTGGTPFNNRTSSEGYDGFQRLNAFYGMLDLKPLQKLRLIVGARAEKNNQNVSDQVWDPQTKAYVQKPVTINQTDWLPSANLIYALTDKINIRAALYKTVARADLRELSSFQYFDYDIYDIIEGSALKTTRIDNADIRFEYYPSPGEVLSISGFYKKFNNPIEVVYIQTSGSPILMYSNLLSAKDFGLEADFRKSLNFLDENSFLKDIYLSGNFTLLDASIEFDPFLSVDAEGNPVPGKRNRPLAGQSPYIINGGILYTGKQFGFNVTYNRYGKRIVFAAASRAIDQYENPRDMIDMQLSYKFLKKQNAEFRFNVSNLLNQEQFIYVNRFPAGNPSGIDEGNKSVEEYPGTGEVVPANQLDPKGTNYNKNYDTKVRQNRFGTTFSLNFIYRF